MNPKSVSSLVQLRRTVALSVLTVALLGPGVAAVAADGDPKPPKVSGQIRYHQKLKARPAGVSLDQHKKNLRDRGLNAEKLDLEQVAFYVTGPLTGDEVRLYATRGIQIDTNNWVPPVPGRHPYGYYLAEVPYNRLEELEVDIRVARIHSTETQSKPQDNVARSLTQVDAVQAGLGFNTPRTGAGVRVAIADSAIDVTHPDFTNNPPFETYDVTTGTGTNNWSTNVTTHKTAHGTSVASVVVGSGTNSGGLYRGVAPAVQWAFYKIGDAQSFTTPADEVKAINRAVAANCKVFTLSYAGFGGFLDGSDAMEQAIDIAVDSGVTVIVGAGNSANTGIHDSLTLPPATTSDPFALNVANSGTMPSSVGIQVLWRGGASDTNIVLTCTNLAVDESLVSLVSETSLRNTRRRLYLLSGVVGGTKTYYLRAQNTAASGSTPLVHCYVLPLAPLVAPTFADPDPRYTVGSPAIADGAIAVAAYTHRTNWTDCSGVPRIVDQGFSGQLGQIAPFSSRGPRIDDLQKPDMAAPGAFTISAGTRLETLDPPLTIQNVGTAGCSYYASAGTSIAAPHAAGIIALLLQAQPGLRPAEVRTLLTTTTTNATTHNTTMGWGLLNASNAVHFAEANVPGVWVSFSHGGVEEGNFTRPFNTVVEAIINAPSAPPAIIPRIRIKAGNRAESIRITSGARIESFGGSARFGTP